MTGKVLWHVTMSMDAFAAGPNDAMDWAFDYATAPSSEAKEGTSRPALSWQEDAGMT